MQAAFRSVVAGNQEGYVFILDIDKTTNDQALQITDLSVSSNLISITCYDHNLTPGLDGLGDYILIKGVQGSTSLNDTVYPVNTIIDENTFTVLQASVSGAYTGGGTITRVSSMNIYTKQYNFYEKDGRNTCLNRVDFLVDKTSDGKFTVDYFASSSDQSLLTGGAASGALLSFPC